LFNFSKLMATNLNTFLYESQTMDWNSYYYDGFKYDWDGSKNPTEDVEQKFIYRIKDIDLSDLFVYRS